MARVKFIHTSDLHLDTPFKGLSHWDEKLSAKLKGATFGSFSKIIDLCIEEAVDFLLISGDSFDSEQKSLAAQLKFVEALKKLEKHHIKAYLICGNHDPLSSWNDHVQLPANVSRFGSSKVEKIRFTKEGRDLADIYGISYNKKTEPRNLSEKYEVQDDPAPFSIALLHGSIGDVGAHEVHAPFKLEDIRSKSFDYWALGHIHKHYIVSAPSPTVVYSGNPQGRDFGETGERGCYLVTLAEGVDPDIQFRPTQLVRFEKIEIDISELDSIDQLPAKVENEVSVLAESSNSDLILRLSLTGRTHLHNDLSRKGEKDGILELLNDSPYESEHSIRIDKLSINTSGIIDEESIRNSRSFAADVLEEFDKYSNEDLRQQLIEELNEEIATAQIKKELENLTPEELEAVLKKAKNLVLDNLIKDDEA